MISPSDNGSSEDHENGKSFFKRLCGLGCLFPDSGHKLIQEIISGTAVFSIIVEMHFVSSCDPCIS